MTVIRNEDHIIVEFPLGKKSIQRVNFKREAMCRNPGEEIIPVFDATDDQLEAYARYFAKFIKNHTKMMRKIR